MFRVIESYATESDRIITCFDSEAEAHAFAQLIAEDSGGIARRDDVGGGCAIYDATPEGCAPSWVRVEPVVETTNIASADAGAIIVRERRGREAAEHFAGRCAERGAPDLRTMPVIDTANPSAFQGSIVARRGGVFVCHAPAEDEMRLHNYQPPAVAEWYIVEQARGEARGLIRRAYGLTRREAREWHQKASL